MRKMTLGIFGVIAAAVAFGLGACTNAPTSISYDCPIQLASGDTVVSTLPDTLQLRCNQTP